MPRMSRIAALLVPLTLLLGSTALAAPDDRACRSDADCRIVAPSGCCTGCAGEPRAVSKRWRPPVCSCMLEQPEEGCPAARSPEDFRAVCQKKLCVRIEKPQKPAKPIRPIAPPANPLDPLAPSPRPVPIPPPPRPIQGECDTDAQCRIDTFAGCCSPCIGEPRAIPVNAPFPACACALPTPHVTVGKQQECPPVQPADKFRAVCRGHHCLRVERR